MKTIHFILQGKGGVGKSLVANMLMQYALERNIPTVAIDTDPVNKSLASYSGFNAVRLNLLDRHKKIDEKRFDDLVRLILESECENFIIDNGASSFISLGNYLSENQIVELLKESGFKVVIHTVITGGPGITHTLSGLKALVNLNAPIVVWLNEYFGDVELNGKEFTDLKVFQENESSILAILSLNKQSRLFEEDFEWFLKQHKTFDEVLNSSDVCILNKQRIKKVKQDIFTQIEGLYREFVD